MNNLTDINYERKNWFLDRIRKYQVVSFTFGFLLFYRVITTLITYFVNKESFEKELGLNIWFWLIVILVSYFLQWLFVTWLVSKYSKEKIKQKFLRHPIATVILFILYLTDLPYRLSEYSDGGVINIFETIVYYAFISFLWWLLICWISSKVFKNQRLHWLWYRKVIDIIFVIMPIAYKFTLGLIVAMILFFVIYLLITVVFKYSGQDLKVLFP